MAAPQLPAPDARLVSAAAERADRPERTFADEESRRWLRALRGTAGERDDATERLHALLLHAARFEVARRRPTGDDRPGDLDDLAVQAADDALTAIIDRLDTYRADRRFTTWAYKFVLRDVAVKVRARRWHERELPPESDGWARLSANATGACAQQADASVLVRAVLAAAADVLTPQQRAVLIALALNDVPIDVLAERGNTTRGAVYQTVRDARRELRLRLEADGLRPCCAPKR